MTRPEYLAAIGLRIQYLQASMRASLLSSIYLLVQPHLDVGQLNDFSKFYEQMILGVSEEAREEGVVPKTLNELQAYINENMEGIPESVKLICLQLVERMRRPPPLEV